VDQRSHVVSEPGTRYELDEVPDGDLARSNDATVDASQAPRLVPPVVHPTQRIETEALAKLLAASL
jgi:hypothetical protein